MSSREKLIEILSRKVYPREGIDPAVVVADYLLDNDILPVVRCKDCKYRTKDTRWTRAGFCGRRGAGDCFAAPPEGYCSYGEREENNGVD